MNTDFLMFRASIEMSIILLCLFSIVYLASVNWKNNRWLILIFSLHFWVIFHYMMSSGGYGLFTDNSFLLNITPLMLYFPALYFYTHELVKPNNITFYQRLPHFIPFVVLYITGVIVGYDNPMETFLQKNCAYFALSFIIVNLMTILIYSYYILQLVKLNQHKYQDKYAASNSFLTLQWINWMVIFLILLPFIGALLHFSLNSFLIEGEIIVVTISILLGMMVLAFFTFRQPILYQEEQKEIEHKQIEKKVKKLVTHSVIEADNDTNKFSLSGTEKAALILKIKTFFKETEPYLNPKIRMPELAKSLHIPRHIFSFIINEHYGMNFFNLINQYRVEHAKHLLKNEEMKFYTLETIGEMSGFNSRTTFHKRFKEQVGISPKEFQKGNDE